MRFPGNGLRRRTNDGAALITVLMIVALASVTVTDLVARQHFDLRLTRSRDAMTQARQVSLGAEAWAAAILYEDARDSQIDSLDEDWAIVLPPVPVQGGTVSGQLEDLQARYNLNSLLETNGKISPSESEKLRRLLTALELDTGIASAIADWLDSDQQPDGASGAEDDYYSGLESPYRAANRPFTSISELRLVRGIDAEAYEKLAPHVSALPATTGINVNTAGVMVLRSIDEAITDAIAEQLISEREDSPFESVEAFVNHSLLPSGDDEKIQTAGLTVASSYFKVRGVVELGPVELRASSWLQRGGNGVTQVLRRTRGED